VRLVFDTNVLVSAWLWQGPPHLLLRCVRDGLASLVVSPELLAEFAEAMERPKFLAIQQRAGVPAEQALNQLQDMAEIVSPAPLDRPVCRDPDDDYLLALATTAAADLLISGDDDLLALGNFGGVSIVSPAAALASLKPLNP
jgi:putative PIN family toxin of toxin-antitoxin system